MRWAPRSLRRCCVAASQLVVYIANPIQTISESITDMRSAKEIITKIQTLLNEAPTTESGTEDTPEHFTNLTINHVCSMLFIFGAFSEQNWARTAFYSRPCSAYHWLFDSDF